MRERNEPAYGRSHFERRLKRANAEMDKLQNNLDDKMDIEKAIEIERKISIVAMRIEYLTNILQEAMQINPKYQKANKLKSVPNTINNYNND